MRNVIVGKTYRHVSGNYYRVICIALDTVEKEDGKPRQMVVYESLSTDAKIFVRPLSLFNALDTEGIQKYRFEMID